MIFIHTAYRFNTRVYAQPILHKEVAVHYGLQEAAPDQFDAEVSEQQAAPAPKVRKEFPETWLWESVDLTR